MEVFGFIALVIIIAIVFRLFAGSMDGERVNEYIERRGGELLEMHWAPFGTGWFGAKSDRIYEIRFRDHDGNICAATAKTSLFTGVYFTEDRIVSWAQPPEASTDANPPQETAVDLAEENRRLKQRIAELEARNT